jgi:transcriptional regulator with XRE-family HTH domain
VAGTEREEWERFGRWLRTRRIEVGLTKAALARAAGVSLSTVRTLEFGGVLRGDTWVAPAPKDRTLARLAAALNTAPDDVFGRAGRRPPAHGIELTLDIREKIDLLTLEARGAVEAIIDHLLADSTTER